MIKKDTFSLTMEEEQMMTALRALNTIRSGFKAKARKLCRKIPRINLENLQDKENAYKDLQSDVLETIISSKSGRVSFLWMKKEYKSILRLRLVEVMNQTKLKLF